MRCGDALFVGFACPTRPRPRRAPVAGPAEWPDGPGEQRTAAGRDGSDEEPPRYVRIGNALLAITEDVIYVGIAVVLASPRGALLVSAADGLFDLGGDEAASEVVLSSSTRSCSSSSSSSCSSPCG